MEPLSRTLTREELADATALGRRTIDVLVNSGTLTARSGAIEASEVETLLRNALMGLYRAEAEGTRVVAPVVAAPVQQQGAEPEFEIERFEFDRTPVEAGAEATVVPFVAPVEAEEESADLRVAVRYVPRRQIGGTFSRVKFTIAQISNTGLRIHHKESLLPGEEARLSFSLMKPARTFVMKARVVWTSIAQRGGESVCISGLRVVDFPERLHQAVDVLREARELGPDATARRTVAAAGTSKANGPLRDVTDDEVAAILKAVRHFAADPVDANRWYARARFAVSDENIRRAAPPRASDREQVLGIWEYLSRRVDLQKIAAVISWSRNIRTAAV